MGALKQRMIEWMEDQNLSQEDLDDMEDISKLFIEWIERHLTPEQN